MHLWRVSRLAGSGALPSLAPAPSDVAPASEGGPRLSVVSRDYLRTLPDYTSTLPIPRSKSANPGLLQAASAVQQHVPPFCLHPVGQ
jgi:hypothetical protein